MTLSPTELHSDMPSLRPATVADIPVICALAHKIWHEHYPEIITFEQIDYMLSQWYDPALLEKQIAGGEQQVWLALRAHTQEPCGYIAISRRGEGDYYLNKFYLDERGKGIGAYVFRQVTALLPDLKVMRLNVNRRNFRSVNFYFKMGFIIESVYELPVGDRFMMDDFVMVWKATR